MFSTKESIRLSLQLSMEPKWKELLVAMREAREHGVPIRAREIAAVERTLARVARREQESIESVARMLKQQLSARSEQRSTG